MAKVRTPVRVPATLLFQRPAVDPMALLLQAQQLIASGQHGRAITLIQPVLAYPHLQPEANYLLGRALKAGGDIGGAEAAYGQALALRPGYVEALVSLGIVKKMRGDVDAAIALYDQALRLDPSFAPAHANRAGAMALRTSLAADNPLDEIPSDEVIEAQAHAVSLAPDNAVVLRNHGVMLMRARRRVEAAQAFNRALTVDPTDVDACIHMGVCLRALGDNQLAIGLYEKWLGINAPSAPVMRALAGLLTREGQVDVARAWAEKAIAVDPDPYALIQLGSTLMQSRRLVEALAHCQRAVELSGGRADIYPTLLLGLTYLHDDPQPIFDAHEAFGRQIKPAATPRPAWRPLAPGERLKVGYVSGDFVRHSVSFFIGGLLELHDKSRFEVTCYHNLGWGDAVTQRLRSYGHRWVECDGLSDEQLRRRIEADGIHILVDLAGHTMHSRIFTFGLGAAPVQISYLGYPTVSGVQAVDFRITDAVIDPGDMPPLASERPLCLPRSMFCYRPDERPPLAPPPALQAGHITFGSFNNIAKVTDHTLDLWAQAMNQVPHSRLLLKSSSMAQASNRDNIERFMGARGIAAERLSLQPWIASKSSHLELYNQVDIALDPFPYNGATTTCEALWMGVPVVTRRGRTHTSRMGASLLGAIGRNDWVADDDAAYVATIVRLAADVDGLAHWRAQARERLAESALFDEPGFVRDFESALQQAWALAATA
jgi:predicted O-linked N-acetylglucosamine transferase (SPINDLY family)